MASKTTDEYVVQTGFFNYLVEDHRGNWLPATANQGDTVKLGKEDSERALLLGAVRKASDDLVETVDEDSDDAADLSDPENFPSGQSDPATLAQVPFQPVVRDTLTATQVAGMGVRELAGWAATHPGQVKSLVEMEKKGRNRPGVVRLGDTDESFDVVEGVPLAAAPSQSRRNTEAVEG